MTDEEISRRQVLRAASVAGGFGIVGGAGAQALLLDEETFSNNAFGAGTLELLVGAKTGETPCNWSPTLEELRALDGTPKVRLEEKSGSIGLAVAVCDNPGRVSLDVTGTRERSTELAAASNGTDRGSSGKPTGVESNKTRSSQGKPAKPAPKVDLVACEGGGNTTLASETLDSLVDRGPISLGGERRCTELGKIENVNSGNDQFIFRYAGEEVTVQIVGRDYKEEGKKDEVAGIELAVIDGPGLCKVEVKGGSGGEEGDGIEPHWFDCAQETGMLHPPENDGGNRPGVSHVVLYVCEGEARCIDCAPHTVYLEWENLRTTTEVDLELTAKQCRHGDAHGGNS